MEIQSYILWAWVILVGTTTIQLQCLMYILYMFVWHHQSCLLILEMLFKNKHGSRFQSLIYDICVIAGERLDVYIFTEILLFGREFLSNRKLHRKI